jgi:hypothetical protein
MQTETVTLGDREYTLTELPVRPGKAFRDALKIHFGSLLEAIRQAPELDTEDYDSIQSIIRSVGATVLDSTALMLDMLVLYSPEIKADEEYLLDHAGGSQIMDAFIACLILTFPFFESQRLRVLYTTLQSVGLTEKLTKTNSASRNGASGVTSLIREVSKASVQATSADENGKPSSELSKSSEG